MKVLYNQSFEQQRKKYGFCFTCENCRYYCAPRQICGHEFPNEEHRLDYYDPANPPEEILFCKEFELV